MDLTATDKDGGEGYASQSVEVEAPTILISDTTVTEGGDAVFEVTLSKAVPWEVSVSYETSDGVKDSSPPKYDAAKAGKDYTSESSSLMFTEAIDVLGDTQPDFPGTPNIKVAGEGGGFTISAGPSGIYDMAVDGCGGSAIVINNSDGGNTVSGCYLGIAPDGTSGEGNLEYGVLIDGSAGNSLQDNVISGNSWGGVHITGEGSTSNTLERNKIGTDAEGTAAVANQGTGVVIDDGASGNTIGTSGNGNIISGNEGNGVTIDGDGTDSNVLQSNSIGADANGTPIGNMASGVLIRDGAKSNLVGSEDSYDQANVIGANSECGVRIMDGDTDGNVVAGNYIGTNSDYTTSLGNGNDGVLVENGAQSNRIGVNDDYGSVCDAQRNVIACNAWNGVHIKDSDTTNNTVAGNYIGTNVAGDSLGNTQDGVEIENSAPSNLIGSDGAGDSDALAAKGNVIGFNRFGVRINGSGTDHNVVAGNYIGTNAADANIGNTEDGVRIEAGAKYCRIGVNNRFGTISSAQANVISNNGCNGVSVLSADTTNNTVAGNKIGVNVDGGHTSPNQHYGVEVGNGASDTLIGSDGSGTSDEQVWKQNVIAGNVLSGVRITGSGTDHNVVAGNYIGTNSIGDDLGNLEDGVRIDNGAKYNRIGVNNHFGAISEGQSNVIAWNGESGVNLLGADTTNNTVAGDYIGTDSADNELGNGEDGIRIDAGASSNLIGSDCNGTTDDLEGNVVAYNDGCGVCVVSGTQNAIRRNSIYGNGALGIDLDDDGITLNDDQDPDSGANDLQNFPTITGVAPGSGNTTISGSLSSAPDATYHVELFSNDPTDPHPGTNGKTFLASTNVTTDDFGDGTFSITVPGAPTLITATATDSSGNTSEFGSFGLDLLVDTNRDGDVTGADERGKDTWTASRGAIILANADDDVEDNCYEGDDIPDNWPGGELDGEDYTFPDTTINGAKDRDDIGPLHLKKLGVATLPSDMTITLKVEAVPGEDDYWAGPVNERVRIFLPEGVDGDDWVLENDSSELLGPTEGATVTFWNHPESEDDYSIFAGPGTVNFGIEGIMVGAPVRVTAELRLATTLVATDTVQVKVSPFIAFSHKQPVDTGGECNGPTVYVADAGTDNEKLRSNLETAFGATNVEPVSPMEVSDVWWQDAYEIGYVQAPYGQMHMVLELPRATHPSEEFDKYARTEMMRDGVGLIPDFAGDDFNDQSDGGNFEVQPGAGGPFGTITMGERGADMMDSEVIDFLMAQGVQKVVPDVDLSWMTLGHIDEVVSFASNVGNRARVASPETAWALLLIAERDFGGGSAAMLQEMNKLGPGGTTVDDVLCDDDLRTRNFGADGYSDNLLDVRRSLGLTDPVFNMASGPETPAYLLLRAGYLDVYDSLFTYGDEIEWQLTFTTADDYTIAYRKAGTGNWTQDGIGNRNIDSVSASRVVYILRDWWDVDETTVAGNTVTFRTKPSPNMIEMPVLMEDSVAIDPHDPNRRPGAVAYTNNVINSIVSGNTLLVARTYGPQVMPGGVDILQWYVAEAATKVGFTAVLPCEEVFYHNGSGSIHCGTNVLRLIPGVGDEWWNYL